MKKFLDKIDESFRLLEEEPIAGPPPAGGAPTDPVAAAGPEPAAETPPPPETPESELPDEEDEESKDDIVKVKSDYVEMVRKALIMAPKHIDDIDYAKLTKIVDTENFEEMNELVTHIVRNNYPHPEM